MRSWSALVAIVLAIALAGCAHLTAEQPLFSVADQRGPPPIGEGVWITLGEGCAEANTHRRRGRFPKDCSPLEIARLADGEWTAQLRPDLIFGMTAEEREEAEAQAAQLERFLVVPAVERALADDEYAPAYIFEYRPESPGQRASYALAVPLSPLPATALAFAPDISCFSALRDGPIDGVREEFEERVDEAGETRRELTGCVAAHQRAVREAARRVIVEDAAGPLEIRLVRVRDR
jgi:hypothetical protein